MAPRLPANLRPLEDVFSEWWGRLGDKDVACSEFTRSWSEGRLIIVQYVDGKPRTVPRKRTRIGCDPADPLNPAVFVGDTVQAGAFYVGELDDPAPEPEIATAAPDDSRPPPRPRGPAQQKNWLAICAEIARRCVDDRGRVSVPKSDRALTNNMLEWCSNDLDVDVAESSMREAVRAVCAALRKVQK